MLAPSLSINLVLLYTLTFQIIGHMDFELVTFHSHKHLENTHLYFLTINSNHSNWLLTLISTPSPSSAPCPFYFLHMVLLFASPPYWFSCLVFFLIVVPSSVYTVSAHALLLYDSLNSPAIYSRKSPNFFLNITQRRFLTWPLFTFSVHVSVLHSHT